jgi:hypothetical protein
MYKSAWLRRNSIIALYIGRRPTQPRHSLFPRKTLISSSHLRTRRENASKDIRPPLGLLHIHAPGDCTMKMVQYAPCRLECSPILNAKLPLPDQVR